MRNRTPRITRFAMVLGLICVALGYFVLSSILRQKRNVRPAEAVYLEKESEVTLSYAYKEELP
jgi:hypothetical protein